MNWKPIKTAPPTSYEDMVDLWVEYPGDRAQRLPDCWFQAESGEWHMSEGAGSLVIDIGTPTHWMRVEPPKDRKRHA